MADINWAALGQQVTIFTIAGWLYWQAVKWCARANESAERRRASIERTSTLYAIAEYLEQKNAASLHPVSDKESGSDREWEGPFMLDEPTPPKAA